MDQSQGLGCFTYRLGVISALTTKQTGGASGVGQPSAPPLQSTNCPHLWEPPKHLGGTKPATGIHPPILAFAPISPITRRPSPAKRPLVHIGTGHSSPRTDPEHSASASLPLHLDRDRRRISALKCRHRATPALPAKWRGSTRMSTRACLEATGTMTASTLVSQPAASCAVSCCSMTDPATRLGSSGKLRSRAQDWYVLPPRTSRTNPLDIRLICGNGVPGGTTHC